MIAVVVFVGSAALVAWVYAGYPLMLALLGRLRPRPRRRAPLQPPLSVIVAAHNEVAVIADKVADVLASDYPTPLLELVVASDGSDDGTVEAARRAGATRVLDLPRVGKLPALNRAAEISSGEILVFTDADTRFERRTLRELVSNFADDNVGGVAANVVLRRGGWPARRARRGPVLALRALREAARGSGRQRGVGQRPPVRGAAGAASRPRPWQPGPTTSSSPATSCERAPGSPSTSGRSSSWRRPRRA